LRPDEDPSPEDQARFGGETTECPGCGASVYDEATWCHKCGKVLEESSGGESSSLPPWALGTAVVVIGTVLILYLVRVF